MKQDFYRCADRRASRELHLDKITRVQFTALAYNCREANVYWRMAIRLIPSLADSLVSNRPKELDLSFASMSDHARMLRFSIPSEMMECYNYLCRIVNETPYPRPLIARLPSGGFRYRLSDGWAEIVLADIHSQGQIFVYGWEDTTDPEPIARGLEKVGFQVTATRLLVAPQIQYGRVRTA